MTLLYLFILIAPTPEFAPPTHRETITRSLQFAETTAKSELWLKNIEGNVKIIGYDGETVEITVEKTIDATTQGRLQKGIEEVTLTTELDSNIMLVYMDAPFVDAHRKGDHFHYHADRHDDDYEYRMDFTVRVPRNVNLEVSTINDGALTIENMQPQRIEAHNVNGPIRCIDISGQTSAITVNGDIDISFVKAPNTHCRFKTVNGDINVLAPQDFSGDISFKSMNGEFYTNFEQIDYLPAEVSSTKEGRQNRTTYRIDRSTKIRIGQGGATVETETLNGEVYLKHS